MKYLPELIFSTLVFLTCLMMYHEIPGGAEFFTISMVLLSFLYIPFGFFYLNEIPVGRLFLKETYQKISRLRKNGVMFASAVFWILTFGITFKIRVLPGAEELLVLGLISAFIVLITLNFRFLKSSDKSFYKRMIIRCSIFIFLGIILQSTSYLTIVKNLHSSNEEFMKIYREYEADPTDYNKLRLEEELIHPTK